MRNLETHVPRNFAVVEPYASAALMMQCYQVMVSVQLSCGPVVGSTEPGGIRFLGIPYAAPPVGPLRLREPQPVSPWQQVLDCSKVGKESVQPNSGPMAGLIPPRKAPIDSATGLPDYMGEDCLVLDVHTPKLEGKLPVMVWIHGGAFVTGAGANPIYQAKGFLDRGVLLVSINYRLGVLGFFFNPRDPSSVANLGLLDQLAALRWVQREIGKFGGDPENVTVFGESAGAMSIGCLLGSPLSASLFKRAILQSGACHQVLHPSQAQESARLLAEELKVQGELTAEHLRTVPVKDILQAQERAMMKILAKPALGRYLKGLLLLAPVLAGPMYPSSQLPLDYLRAARPRVECMMGTTDEEFRLFMFGSNKKEYSNESLTKWLDQTLTGDPVWEDSSAKKVVNTIAETRSAEDTYVRVQSDLLFDLPMWQLASVLASGPSPAFLYRFAWRSPFKKLGACHALELPFVFGALKMPGINMFAGSGVEADKLSSLLQDVWTGFAKSGKAGWPSYSPEAKHIMAFGKANKGDMELETGLRAREVEVWSHTRATPRAKL